MPPLVDSEGNLDTIRPLVPARGNKPESVGGSETSFATAVNKVMEWEFDLQRQKELAIEFERDTSVHNKQAEVEVDNRKSKKTEEEQSRVSIIDKDYLN